MTDLAAPQVANPVTAKSSAVKAGWICLVLGFLTFWIFGFGFIFFAATFILAIVAMCTNRVGQGIALLVSSVGSSFVCAIIALGLVSSAFTAALQKQRATQLAHATPRVQLHQAATSETPQLQHQTATETSLQDLLGPGKNSLIVSVNTASAKELESLPNIGSSRAEQIIAHRPYTSVDELSQVKGVTPRVLDQLRPFVKTDGATEPRLH
ncbi:MAG TPA: helix-hairpin-helix domain-containing protein [Terriglobales bacterium]|nr:helix-hairpin-helix domain-containing protein [Terriglobales bacterium]